MSDALISPAVFAATSAIALALVGIATRQVSRTSRKRDLSSLTEQVNEQRIVPLMGVMGALIFAAQMLNFAIPATGSSGHIVGGILLAAILGPWAGFLTLTSIIVIQCLLFADGGLMALGCNILNMAAISCLVAYPLVFKPLVYHRTSALRWGIASIAASITALAMGALAVTIETEMSEITALPYARFIVFMIPIHLLIGLGEGLATAAVIAALRRYRPDLLHDAEYTEPKRRSIFFAAVIAIALIGGTVAGSIASSAPDGLEWSIERTTEGNQLAQYQSAIHQETAETQQATALLPDYNTTLSGIVGIGATLVLIYALSLLFRRQ